MAASNLIVAKMCTADIDPISLVFWRWMLAWLAFTPFMIKKVFAEKKIILTNVKAIFFCALTGTLYNGFMYSATHYTTSINSSIIASTFPVFTIIVAYFMHKESITSVKIISIFTALLGTCIIMTDGQLSELQGLFNNFGDILALFGSISWAFYVVYAKFKCKDLSITTFTYAITTVGVILAMPFYFLQANGGHSIVWSWDVVLMILYVAIPVSIIGFSCWNLSVVKIGALQTSLIFYLAPVFNIVLAGIILDESLTYHDAIGLSIILFAINLPIIESQLKKRLSRTRRSQNHVQSADI
jgi:drug/metabolite transporter (DMT)-like permease